ncbi:ABC transporter substrate-binding protein [Rhizobium sp. SG_E_25_P2]|uniref:ABC transporter substrate-binding protein n=1 Tax=Rhizobium sp. SG_E_25_P2 TaxID=2879942 RepID=UPI002474E492|nr:ABC transporter substrate-binding protein [Rhizobium sp. SG_E_25_P2]
MFPDRLPLSRRAVIASLAVVPLALSARAEAPRFRRIATLDYAVAATLIETGGALAAVAEAADWDKWMGAPALPAGVVNLGSAWEVNFELLAALKPDLIITTPYLDALLPKLKDIAPCLRISVFDGSGEPVLPKAIAETRRMGDYLGASAAISAYLDRSDQLFADCRSRLARLPERDLLLFYLIDDRHAYVYGAPGLYQGALDRLGVKNAWTSPCNYWGFAMTGLEGLGAAAGDSTHAILFEPTPRDVMAKIGQSPIWQALPFNRTGRLSILPPALAYGMVTEATRFADLLTSAIEARS